MTAAPSAQAQQIPRGHLLFATSSHCISCHSQIAAPDGEDISFGYDWRGTMMANSARDPYWQAAVRRETMDHPDLAAAIEDKCATCHMPMQRTQAQAAGQPGRVLDYLAAIHSGAALVEPNFTLANAADPLATLAADGVSCTLCHQIQPDNLGEESSLDGGFVIDLTTPPEQRVLFGRFPVPDAGRVRLMHSATGFLTAQSEHVRDSALCATCHTLFTESVDDQGRPAGRLPEQVPYEEWLHSDYVQSQSCQSCHMPAVAGLAPMTSTQSTLHEGISRHTFVGANAFILTMLDTYRAELGVVATPAELAASAQRNQAFLAEQTARLSIGAPRLENGRLSFAVTVENLAGHKLPTAYPSRRVWLHVVVRDAAGAVAFESGAPQPDGSIAGADSDADANRYEPHYERITAPDQVQIYESIMGDFAGRPTTGLLFGTHYLKDSRLLPHGFDKATAQDDIRVRGAAMEDADFAGGGDTVIYDIPLAGGAPYTVEVTLLYQSISYRWARNLEAYDAPEPQRFVGYYAAQAGQSAELIARASARTD